MTLRDKMLAWAIIIVLMYVTTVFVHAAWEHGMKKLEPKPVPECTAIGYKEQPCP